MKKRWFVKHTIVVYEELLGDDESFSHSIQTVANEATDGLMICTSHQARVVWRSRLPEDAKSFFSALEDQ